MCLKNSISLSLGGIHIQSISEITSLNYLSLIKVCETLESMPDFESEIQQSPGAKAPNLPRLHITHVRSTTVLRRDRQTGRVLEDLRNDTRPNISPLHVPRLYLTFLHPRTRMAP